MKLILLLTLLSYFYLLAVASASPIEVLAGIKLNGAKNAGLVEVETEETVAQLKEKACGLLLDGEPTVQAECKKLKASTFSDSLDDQKLVSFYQLKDGTPVMME